MLRFTSLLTISIIFASAFVPLDAASIEGFDRHISANATPTPVDQMKPKSTDSSKSEAVTGPIVGTATAVGTSGRVSDLPTATPGASQPPRELNPQNTFPLKVDRTQSSMTPVAKTQPKRGKKKSVKKN